MKLRSGRHLRPPPPCGARSKRQRGPGGADRLSSLHDDILLQVLVHLRRPQDAARASLLSRRWRGLWTRLPHYIFRGVESSEIETTLASLEAAALGHAVSLIGIHIPHLDSVDAARITALLCSAARLSPGELVFVIPSSWIRSSVIELPCFHRATSIELDIQHLRLTPPSSGEFPALEKLSLSGNINDIGTLLDRCPRLRVLRVTFRGVALGKLEEALASLEAAALGYVVSLIGIHIPHLDSVDAARVTALLCSAARLSLGELVFIVRRSWICSGVIELPCFHRATSIEIDIQHLSLTLTLPPAGEFSALEKLSLSGNISDIGTLLDRCPRLRVLKVTKATMFQRNIMVHSASLQEIDVDSNMNCEGIDVVTPVLKQLTLKVKASMDLSISILAPMAKKVLWQCSYQGWLALVSADMCAYDPLDAELNTAQKEIEKLPSSILELHLKTMGHVFRSILLHLLAVVQISTATKRIKVVLQRFKNSEVAQACLGGNCPSCDEPNDSRSIIAALTHLEEVEIEGFQGEDSEFHFLKLIIGCAPMLRMTVKLSPQIKPDNYGGCRKKLINSISAMHRPSATYHVYLSSGKLVLHSCLECSRNTNTIHGYLS